jgi:hypothetical protein
MQLLNNIKELLSLTNKLNQSLAFELVKTSDGEDINISSREIGADVTKGEDDTVADGEYTLEDGFAFTVKDSKIDSIITDIETKEVIVPEELAAEDTPIEDAPEADDKSKEIEELKEQIKELQGQLEALKGEFSSVPKYVTVEELNSLKDVFHTLNENVKILAKLPLEQSKVSTSFKANAKKEEDMTRLRSALSGL